MTYDDDVLLIPAYSVKFYRTVDLSTKFSKNIELKYLIVTAAKGYGKTRAKTANAIAREGNRCDSQKICLIEEQAKDLGSCYCKACENGMISMIL